MADPPLHRRDGGLTAIVTGVGPGSGVVASCVHLGGPLGGPTIPPKRWPISAPHPCESVMLWSNLEEPPHGTLVWIAGHHLYALDTNSGAERVLLHCDAPLAFLRLQQWLGTGQLLVVAQSDHRLEVYAWSAESLEHPPTKWITTEHRPVDDIPWHGPHDMVPAGDMGFAMLFDDTEDWIVLGPQGTHRMPKSEIAQTRVPDLFVMRTGEPYLVEFRPDVGFVAHRVRP